MITANSLPAAHVGEDQASNAFAARSAHWQAVDAGLLEVVKAFANEYLQDERDDVRVCLDAKHHAAVRALFAAIKKADSAAGSDAPLRDPRVADMFEDGGLA